MLTKISKLLNKQKAVILTVTVFTLITIFIINVLASNDNKIVIIETTKGTIKAELAIKDAPRTTKNFITLIKKGFYNGLTFHRVEPGFVIQGGDPVGNGTGGSGKEISLEIKCKDGRVIIGKTAPRTCQPVLTHTKGALSMARAMDPNSASSQFFITLDNTHFLDRKYAVFGYVTEGQDIVDKIQVGDKMNKVTLE
ncbi:MAG: peptidylprolyl isomerase [Spirochaetota bacterium]|nr:peptidylprolyl isomerase [Spirochaetota bacterium]